jgi:hypothetical protein
MNFPTPDDGGTCDVRQIDHSLLGDNVQVAVAVSYKKVSGAVLVMQTRDAHVAQAVGFIQSGKRLIGCVETENAIVGCAKYGVAFSNYDIHQAVV